MNIICVHDDAWYFPKCQVYIHIHAHLAVCKNILVKIRVLEAMLIVELYELHQGMSAIHAGMGT